MSTISVAVLCIDYMYVESYSGNWLRRAGDRDAHLNVLIEYRLAWEREARTKILAYRCTLFECGVCY